jgi:hypothetical protein
MKHSVGRALFPSELRGSRLGVNKIPSPISTHLPGRSSSQLSVLSSALRCAVFKFFPAFHPIQFHLLFLSLLLVRPLQRGSFCRSSGAALMSYMMYGIKYFEHVESFYVSWISKKAKEISRFVLSQRREKEILKA